MRLVEDKLVVKLKYSFEQRSVSLLDRLAAHLKARIPQLKRLQYEPGGGGGIETIVL